MSVVLAALSSAAMAQPAPATPQLGTIEVQENAPGQNVSTVDRNRLLNEQGPKLDDTLRSMAGVFTRQTAQQPGVAVNIRGFEGQGRVNMMIDGVRQSFRFTGHEAAGFTYIDPMLLAGIDISRGEVTGLGGGGLAGSANFRTLGVDDIVDPGKTVGGLARLSWGSNGVGFQEMLAGGVRIDQFGIAGAISRRNSDNYHDGYGNSVPHSGQDLISGLIKGTWTNGIHSINLGGVFYDNDFAANSYYQTVNNKTFNLGYRYNPGSDLIDLHINARANILNMKYTAGISGAPPYVGRTIQDNGVGFDIANDSRFYLGSWTLLSSNGLEYFHDDVKAHNGGVNPGSGEASTLGVFTNNTFRYGIVDFIAGLRFNRYTIDGKGVLSDSQGAYSVDQDDSSFDPKFTLALNVTPWLQPYVSWGRSMRAPSLQETMLGGDHPGGQTQGFIPNPFLKPEQSQGWEAGVNVNRADLLMPHDSLTMRVNYFNKDVEDYIAARAVGRVFQYQNIPGTTHVSGWEVEANYDAGFAFGGVTFTQIDNDLPTQQPGVGASQYLPDQVYSLNAGFRAFERRLTMGGRFDHVSDGKAATFAGDVAQSGKAYDLVGLYATYKLTENVDLNTRVTNLFDTAYTPFLSTIGTGQGRTFYVSTQVKF